MAGLENALSQIQRLCSTGDPLPAHQHPRYARYINQAWWDLPTDTIIGKRRTFTSFLGSGALHTVLVDDIQLGVDLVQYHESRPVRGSIITEVIAPRPFTFQGRYRDEQKTTLGLYVCNDLQPDAALGGTLPFDEQMDADTRNAWAEWGMKLHYRVNEKREVMYTFEPLNNFEETIAAKLGDLT